MQALYPSNYCLFCAPLLLVLLCTTSKAQTALGPAHRGAAIDESRIEEALRERGSIDFVETPLRDVVDTIRRQFKIQIVVASKRLEEASVSLDARVTKQLDGLPLESILRLVLSDLELNFTIRENVLLISTPEDIESQLDTRVYPVLDLVVTRTEFAHGAPRLAPADYDSLIELIKSTIKPDSWDDVGGPGAIDSSYNAGAIVVSQTRDVHRQIENLLDSLRQARTDQNLPSLPVPKTISQRAVSRSTSNTTRRYSPPSSQNWQAWQLPRVFPSEK